MIMPTLAGPHAPHFVAKGDFTRQAYIVMEYIPGASLRPRFDEAPLPLDEVVEIGSRVATALHDIHLQHVIHFDIKPSNVMLRPDGTAVLLDFGLSRHDHLPDLLAEEFRLPMGTGPYMSPEQVQYARHDPRSDIFALGVMLYSFTTGERPFGSPSTVSGLRRRLYVDPIPPRTLRPGCPPWLQEIILKCLEVKPAARWQSAAQLALAFQHPDQVPLTERAAKRARSGLITRARRWFYAIGSDPAEAAARSGGAAGAAGTALAVQRGSIIMAAVDTEGATAALLTQLRATVRRVMLTETGARLACVSVMRTARIGMDELVDKQGQSRHVKQLVQLKHWARPLRKEFGLDEGRLTFHVLEAPDPAAALLDFAERNAVDHLVMGARGNSGVILSQALRGFAEGVGTTARLDGASLANGLRQAAQQAYRAVSKPQEGTMLTVLREAGDAAMTEADTLPGDGRGTGCAPVLAAAVRAADRAEAATIDQLPALQEAGVPDAGGEGVCVILRGLLAAIVGGAPEVREHVTNRPIALAAGHGDDAAGRSRSTTRPIAG